VLVPGKKAEKGYVLLRETLKDTGKAGIGRVVLRTKEYLCAVMPQDDALVLEILRFEQELIDASEYKLPSGKVAEYRVSAKELAMAQQLIESMAGEWKPEEFRDEFRERLSQVIEDRLKSKGLVTNVEGRAEAEDETATTNVVDFMALLQKSLASNKRTPARKAAAGDDDEPGGKPATKARKATAKKAAPRAAPRKAPAKAKASARKSTTRRSA
jgi:DNA end-binding protein Ku